MICLKWSLKSYRYQIVSIYNIHSRIAISWLYINSSPPRQNGRLFASDRFKLSWIKTFVFRLELHWSLLLIYIYIYIYICPIDNEPAWFRLWLHAKEATSHYMNQCLPSSLLHICSAWISLKEHNLIYDMFTQHIRRIIRYYIICRWYVSIDLIHYS